MARRRAAGGVDLRALHLEHLLASHRYRRRPQDMAAQLAAVRGGKPFVAQGWQLGLQPMHATYCVETNGNLIEVEDVVEDGVHRYWRPDGTEVLP